MDATVGICAYNEEGNIGPLIDALNLQTCKSIKQIIVVSSGSTDSTDAIVEEHKSNKLRLIREEQRRGKVSAINLIIKAATTPLIVLISADVLPKKNAIAELIKPFTDPRIGIAGARPVPINKKTHPVGFAVHVVWGLHDSISRHTPKFGECIAFRKVLAGVPDSAVDEEEIASLLYKKGYKGVYCPKAIVLNKGPETLKDFIRQRRRIYAGHLALKAKSAHEPPTMNNLNLLWLLLSNADFKAPVRTLFAVFIEGTARLLGLLDFALKRNHNVWKPSPTTKNLKPL
jgi:poly-beta-1,6-N-acetyl-D-glucosamine synthase